MATSTVAKGMDMDSLTVVYRRLTSHFPLSHVAGQLQDKYSANVLSIPLYDYSKGEMNT